MDELSRGVLTFLLNSLWQVAVVVSATAFADLWLRRAPARYRHLLWTVSLAAGIILPVASSRPIRIKSAAVNAAVPIPVPSYAHLAASPGSAVVVRSSARPTRLSGVRHMLVAGAHQTVPVPRPVTLGLLILYASFLSFMLVRIERAWLRARSIQRLASPEPLPAQVVSTLERCRRATPRGRRPRPALNPSLLWSAEIPGPVTVGALRGAIILPKALLGEDAREELEAALVHEMAHVCRRDYLGNLIAEFLLLPVAFHPLTWLLKRRLAEARELACDEWAARVLDPARYARSLVRIANQISSRTSATLKLDYTLGVFDANILEERVMTLLKPRARGRLAKFSVVAGTLAIVSSCLLAARFSLAVGQASNTRGRAAANAGNQFNQYPGTLSGVSGGISGGVAGGVTAGVAGGVSGSPTNSTYFSKDSASPAPEEFGQADTSGRTGSLSGIVVDANGARIPKAEVRLISRNNSFTQTAESDDTGAFSFDGVPAGRYSLEVSSPGMGGSFRSFEFKAEGQPPFFPFVLHPGSVTETAVVTAKAPESRLKATAVGPRKIRVGGNVEAARLIDSPPPVYPESARAAGLQGDVQILAEISPEGVPVDLKVINSPGDDLSKAALGAVNHWRYQPTLLNGEPVAVVTMISVAFHLEE